MNIIKGDYTFFAWVEGEFERYKNAIEELKSLGYEFVETKNDFLNAYHIYKNIEGDRKVITECCS